MRLKNKLFSLIIRTKKYFGYLFLLFKINGLQKKYSDFTMIRKQTFKKNLLLASRFINISGSIVECGVWRGGMSAALAEIFGSQRKYFLFDSFEGLPEAKPIDGEKAEMWQKATDSPFYFDNCKAEMSYAETSMQRSGAKKYTLVRGWFNETLEKTDTGEIAVLRLDGDWYESTMDCLISLYPKVVHGGLIIIDDYYAWEGARKALYDYLSKEKIGDTIRESPGPVAYIVKGQ